MSGKIITVAIHKGGTGKTTAAVNLSWLAHERNCKTLLIDLDTQGNATYNFMGEVPNGVLTSSVLFGTDLNGKPIASVSEGFDVIPADSNLLSIERYPFEAATTFKNNVQQFKNTYDLIVIDTPPTMGFAMLAPLGASDYTFAPIFPDAYSANGVKSLFERIKNIKTKHNTGLNFIGLLINNWNRSSQTQNKVVKLLKDKLPNFIMPFTIGHHVHIGYSVESKQAVWHGAKSGAHRAAGKAVKEAMGWILNKTVSGGCNNG